MNATTPKVDILSWAASQVQVVTQNGYEKQTGMTGESEKLSATAAAAAVKDRSTAEDVVNFAVANSYDAESFKRLPIGIYLPILSCLYQVWLQTTDNVPRSGKFGRQGFFHYWELFHYWERSEIDT